MMLNSKFYLVKTLLTGWLLLIAALGNTQSTKTLSDTTNEKFIDIGFHKLFISEAGPKNAKFTVLFESGGGGSSKDWARVRAILPSDIHTVAYDRAGLGKSEAGPLPRTMAQEVFELHYLLNAAKIKGPVILVGQSIGGLLARLYCEQYGKNIAGVILVDPTHESSMLGSMRYGGWVRLREKATGKIIPKPQIKRRRARGTTPQQIIWQKNFKKYIFHH